MKKVGLLETEKKSKKAYIIVADASGKDIHFLVKYIDKNIFHQILCTTSELKKNQNE
ncbi:unnamed protein product [Meloidogyne enterolobii]|uniref:Uncharacterized protein n=1 Tax=Meloidogyne enterolobii TaxID=390850 RepID=A0ACB0YNT2_MELEN